MTSNPSNPSTLEDASTIISQLQEYYLQLSLPRRLSNPNREPSFRDLVTRFFFTEMGIDRLPCSNDQYSAAFSAGIATRWTPQDQGVIRAFARRAAGAFMRKRGGRIWGTRELRGREWLSLMAYFELVAGMEADDEVWKAFWEGEETGQAEADDGHLAAAGLV